MRNLISFFAILAGLFSASPASAYSVFLSYTGIVSSDLDLTLPGYPMPVLGPFGANVLGENVTINETFNLSAADTVSHGQYIAIQGNAKFASATIQIGNVSAPFPGALGTFTYQPNGLTGNIGQKGFGLLGLGSTNALLSTATTFSGNASFSNGGLILNEGGFNRDIQFDLSLQSYSVSPVPLPPALPMFACALLALAVFGVYARRQKAHEPETLDQREARAF